MKKAATLLIIALSVFSLNAQNIKLPAPQKDGGDNILKTIDNRQSDRSFKQGDLSLQDLSTILWAGFGYSQNGKRTVPTAMNRQDIVLYVFLEKGIYLYNAKDNVLELVKKGDYRRDTDRPNGFAGKVTNIAICSDLAKYDVQKDHHRAYTFGVMSSAYVSENMYLAADGMRKNIGTVVRYAGFNEKEISDILNLPETTRVLLYQTVGYKK